MSERIFLGAMLHADIIVGHELVFVLRGVAEPLVGMRLSGSMCAAMKATLTSASLPRDAAKTLIDVERPDALIRMMRSASPMLG